MEGVPDTYTKGSMTQSAVRTKAGCFSRGPNRDLPERSAEKTLTPSQAPDYLASIKNESSHIERRLKSAPVVATCTPYAMRQGSPTPAIPTGPQLSSAPHEGNHVHMSPQLLGLRIVISCGTRAWLALETAILVSPL
eukprot:220092-Rhodomonas_salina.4